MAIQYDKLYEGQGKKTFTLACGMISTTSIYFKDAALLVKVEAEGEVFFYDATGELQASCTLERQDRRYNEVICEIKDGKVLLEFTIYKYVDNYPHCDGEHDRWDEIRIGALPVCYDLEQKTATVNA